jgi:hypothetical protein
VVMEVGRVIQVWMDQEKKDQGSVEGSGSWGRGQECEECSGWW